MLQICSNQILHGRSVAVFWLSDVHVQNVPDSLPE